ncbi:uncharacterized protein G2W53_029017 [Senna tora]|uniref:Uncharacterized protein n=1 Tax=Senna tora TaxID=362788 RepID=A0A834T235_9FABA|nr:uncharacterized protein G2W53_029017 [Senna tora]
MRQSGCSVTYKDPLASVKKSDSQQQTLKAIKKRDKCNLQALPTLGTSKGQDRPSPKQFYPNLAGRDLQQLILKKRNHHQYLFRSRWTQLIGTLPQHSGSRLHLDACLNRRHISLIIARTLAPRLISLVYNSTFRRNNPPHFLQRGGRRLARVGVSTNGVKDLTGEVLLSPLATSLDVQLQGRTSSVGHPLIQICELSVDPSAAEDPKKKEHATPCLHFS